MSLPKKIFNRCKDIPFTRTIYRSREDGIYKFCGVRNRRTGNESVFYSIPNNNLPKHPNIKAFQKAEIETLWEYLLINQEIKTVDLKRLCPDLYKEGGCCFSAFYGIINTLYPKVFIKVHGIIKFRKQVKK